MTQESKIIWRKTFLALYMERYWYWRYAAKAVSVLPGPGKMLVGFWKYFEEVKEVSDSKPNYVPTQKCFWLRLLQDISREDLPWNLSQYCLDREKYYLEKEKCLMICLVLSWIHCNMLIWDNMKLSYVSLHQQVGHGTCTLETEVLSFQI